MTTNIPPLSDTAISNYLTRADISRIIGKSKDTVAINITNGAVLDQDYIYKSLRGKRVNAYLRTFVADKVASKFSTETYDISNAVSELQSSLPIQPDQKVENQSGAEVALQSHIDSLQSQIATQSELIVKLLDQKDKDQDILRNNQVLLKNYQEQVSKLTGSATLGQKIDSEPVLSEVDKSTQPTKKKGWFGGLFD